MVAADFEEAGDQDVLHKVVKDFAAKGVAVTAQDVRAKMDELLAQAVAQVKARDVRRSVIPGRAKHELRCAICAPENLNSPGVQLHP